MVDFLVIIQWVMYFVSKEGLFRTPEISLFLSFPAVDQMSDITWYIIHTNNNQHLLTFFCVPILV